MRITPIIVAFSCAALLVAAGDSCAANANYLDPHGPRYAASYAPTADVAVASTRGPILATSENARVSADISAPMTFKVDSYNVRYGEQIDEAIGVLSDTPELAGADVLLLQEMSPFGVDRIARALGFDYVYYPATLRSSGREFGNAAAISRAGV